ncbi:uncharacterized protein [Branchiostoma lanceolatum]|uniref:uncharacterized protein isoform X2 n=1 Tax=Branchiostoma lanceolatum TaxID=7740 RepID=UPI0034547EAC
MDTFSDATDSSPTSFPITPGRPEYPARPVSPITSVPSCSPTGFSVPFYLDVQSGAYSQDSYALMTPRRPPLGQIQAPGNKRARPPPRTVMFNLERLIYNARIRELVSKHELTSMRSPEAFDVIIEFMRRHNYRDADFIDIRKDFQSRMSGRKKILDQKRAKLQRESDVTAKNALGLPHVGTGETQYDQRLFNQSKGLDEDKDLYGDDGTKSSTPTGSCLTKSSAELTAAGGARGQYSSSAWK